jgi:ATP-binding cassette subfamily C protein
MSVEAPAAAARLLTGLGGERLAVGQHNPIRLDQPGRAWLVLEGRVEVQAVPMQGGEPAGLPRHLLAAAPGEVLFALPALAGAGPGGTDLVLRAVAGLGSVVLAADRATLGAAGPDLAQVIWVERWVESLAAALTEGEALPRATLLDADPAQAVAAGTCLAGPAGTLVWARPRDGLLHHLGEAAAAVGPADPPLPLTDRCFATAPAAAVLDGLLTPALAVAGTLWPALDAWHGLVLGHLARRIAAAEAGQAERVARRIAAGAAAFGGQVEAIDRLLDGAGPGGAPVTHGPPQGGAAASDPLLAALAQVAAAAGLPPLRVPAGGADRSDRLQAIARASGFQLRRVRLEGRWWREESEPMLGLLLPPEGPPRPVALLPARGRGVLLADPAVPGPPRPVTPALAAMLHPEAELPYRPLPDEVPDLATLIRFGLRGQAGEMARVALWGLLGGLAGMVPVFAMGAIYGTVLPYDDRDGLVALVLALVVGAFGVAAFGLTRNLAMLRLQGRIDVAVLAGLWMRLLALPLGFFRRHTAGDLTERVGVLGTLREAMTRSVAEAVLALAFSLVSVAAMVWFSWRLALVAMLLAAVIAAASALLSRLERGPQQALAALQGRTLAFSVQLVGAVAKLRIAGAEARAFARWVGLFAEQQRLLWWLRRRGAAQRVLAEAAPLLVMAVLFATVAFGLPAEQEGAAGIAIGDFLSFMAALGQFLGALTGVVGAVSTLRAIEPAWQRVQPILEAAPEMPAGAGRTDPGRIVGDIAFRGVRFGYADADRPVLEGLGFTVRAGEFVAFVGASGSGKSTLLRLLLGLETPQAGSVLIDGKPLQDLDLGLVRRQFGVVVQGARPPAGSLHEVIAGSLPIGTEEVWEAARLAGLADDIRAMPMGLGTVLTDGAGTLSGGQRQRLMIARALAGRPRVLVLDEATSALDNRTQAVVTEAVGRLNMTRIVIAHRLTTIAAAQRIHVLDGGRIVESGRFEELLRAGGPFAELARRQQV